MTNDEIMAKIAGILQDIFEDPDLEVTAETNALMVPGWDSMAQIKLIMAVEEEFSIQLSSREMDQLRNVGDLVTAVSRHA